MDNVILQMKNITKEFPGVKALDNVNLEVRRGEIHALVGENGAGKSTLMNVLSGTYPYGSYEGQILYDGQECQFKTAVIGEEFSCLFPDQFSGKKMMHLPDGGWKGAEKEGGVRFFRYREGYGCVADVVEINAGYEQRDYFRRCEPKPVKGLLRGTVKVCGELHEPF